MLVAVETPMKSTLMAGLLIVMLSPGLVASLRAETLHDANLPTAKPNALQRLSDNRVRQRIMQASQDHYRGRCMCPYMTKDAYKRSCKGRYEHIRTKPQPICYPREISDEMVSHWRRQHP